VLQQVKEASVKDAIVTVRLQGTLHSGKISDIPLQEIIGMLYHKGAYFVMRSTSLLRTKDVEIIHTTASSVEEAENAVIAENKQDADQIKRLMLILSLEKMEGETKYNYEKRIIEETNKLLE